MFPLGLTSYIIGGAFIGIAVAFVYILTARAPSLKIRFGDDYNRYREETPFLIPIPRRKKKKHSE